MILAAVLTVMGAATALAQGIVVNKTDGSKVYFKASEVVSVTTYGYGEDPVTPGGDTGDAPAGAKAVDLGLPSGTKWANMNVGAEKPEDYGLYFARGETTGYTSDTNDGHLFNWESYQYGYYDYDSDYSHLVNIGSDIAGTKYDAATANWGSPWRMPSRAQIRELWDNCISEWTTQNGVDGMKFTGPNGGTIFLPAAGDRWGPDLNYAGTCGVYWSSTLDESDPVDAYGLYFHSGDVFWCDDGGLSNGQSVRPVR